MSQALYRRYRPERFADIIGQDHVTGPLAEAIRNDRVNHAYLFSGPRGCGKTTSARILARCLNCEQGPTPEPCGECPSCIDLARDGSGSIDVIEIDAASHGGVDDARELRERAFFAPAASRYKIYIIDEAHMVSKQGFNALLKLVEEPPEFVKFVFATTEPDAVIGTIRSRTHHYPFRLVGARTLETYLGQVCASEGVTVQPGVLPLVVRAGAGSVRDAMSVLDQLMGGSASTEVGYELAVSLLGFTPAALMDEVVDAVASSDGAAVFAVVDQVIDSGLDPRRFLEDLLQRMRDLVIVAAVPDAFSSGLVAAPDDQRDRMVAQAERLGLAALTRAADLAAAGLTELRGATAPRLQLELVCAKLLLPGAHGDELGLATRLERLERRLAIGGVARSDDAAPPSPATVSEPASPPPVHVEPLAVDGPEPVSEPIVVPEAAAPASAASPSVGAVDLHEIRRLWPNVLEQVKQYRRAVWMMLFERSQVLDVDDRILTLGLGDLGGVRNFGTGGKDEIVRQAVIDVLGLDRVIQAVHDPSLGGPATTQPAAVPGAEVAPSRAVPQAAADARAAAAAVDGPAVGKVRQAPAVDDEVAVDDAEDDPGGLQGEELVLQELGGKVIGEIDHT
ncbi:MAG: DNA polymerase III subunit gamma and tau [Actinomycetes bacterium]